MPCNNLWDSNSQLYAQPFLPKGLSADTSAAYGLMAFIGDHPKLKLVLTGKFPKGSYMSLQIYRGRFQAKTGVGEALSDYRIAANLGGKNPFQTHNPNDTGKFKIEITPDPNAKDGHLENAIWYDTNPDPLESRLISAFYRVYQPAGGQLSFGDLPAIEARDYETDAVLPCPIAQQLDWYLKLPDEIISIANDLCLLLNLAQGRTLKFQTQKLAAGSNGDAVYAGTFKNIPIGRVSVIRFRAPAIRFESPVVGNTTKAVRYWSICSIYWPMLKTLNGVACDWAQPGERDVTVVFGPDDPQIRGKAGALGAEFLPDDREPDQHVMGFIVRNVLPSEAFRPLMFNEETAYFPTGKVYTREEFLSLP